MLFMTSEGATADDKAVKEDVKQDVFSFTSTLYQTYWLKWYQNSIKTEVILFKVGNTSGMTLAYRRYWRDLLFLPPVQQSFPETMICCEIICWSACCELARNKIISCETIRYKVSLYGNSRHEYCAGSIRFCDP